MAQNTEHTPYYISVSGNNFFIKTQKGILKANAVSLEVAEEIVKACNSYQDMYETLRTIVEALHAKEFDRASRVAGVNGVKAIAKAEGRE